MRWLWKLKTLQRSAVIGYWRAHVHREANLPRANIISVWKKNIFADFSHLPTRLYSRDTSARQINYEHLFESDAAGDQCKFAETVREQSLFEYNELIADLQTSMVSLPFVPLNSYHRLISNSAVRPPDSHLRQQQPCDVVQGRDDGSASAP
jgi:hypothetical protein